MLCTICSNSFSSFKTQRCLNQNAPQDVPSKRYPRTCVKCVFIPFPRSPCLIWTSYLEIISGSASALSQEPEHATSLIAFKVLVAQPCVFNSVDVLSLCKVPHVSPSSLRLRMRSYARQMEIHCGTLIAERIIFTEQGIFAAKASEWTS